MSDALFSQLNGPSRRLWHIGRGQLLVPALLLAFLLGAGTFRSAAAQTVQTEPPLAVAKFDNAIIRSGPSTIYPVVGLLPFGKSCPLSGRDNASGWWLVRCSDVLTGWISFEVVTIVGDSSVTPLFTVDTPSVISLPEIVAPPAPAVSGWRAGYFANANLLGAPVLVQDMPEINFNWGLGSPGPALPPELFSARYERTLALAPGDYRLTLRMDGGARVFVDDQPVIDDWRAGPLRELSLVQTLGSAPRLRVEYFEDGGPASVFFSVTPLTAGANEPAAALPAWRLPAAAPVVPQDQWRVQYYNNTDLAGSTAAVQIEARGLYPIDHNWGAAAPQVGIGSDFWSARYTGRFYFPGGDYTFFAQSDDGVRVYLDNILVINGWFDGSNDRSSRFDELSAGYHIVQVDYYERSEEARLRVWWSSAGSPPPATGSIPPPPT